MNRELTDHNIILIGYMGSGKSTIAKEISKKRGLKMIDTDEMIVEAQGRSINAIFASDGEAAFREMETEVLKFLLDKPQGFILSTGGGMPMREENRTLLKRLGTVYFLKAEVETILERVKNDSQRPLLKDPDRRSKVTKMLEVRTPLYEDAADHVILTDHKTVEEVVTEIFSYAESDVI